MNVTGEQFYAAYRKSMQTCGRSRGLNAEPRWKSLKPWRRRVYERAAAILNEENPSRAAQTPVAGEE